MQNELKQNPDDFSALTTYIYKKLGGGKAEKKSEAAPLAQPAFKNWFWASEIQPKKKITDDVGAKDGAAMSVEEEIRQMLVDNPAMNSATFYNLCKSKGIKFAKEAEMTGGNIQLVRESSQVTLGNLNFRCRFKEGLSPAAPGSASKFQAILIQEGLGNLKDGYYYTRAAIESAIPVFEGAKMYADHPSSLDEQIRPERSVRDIIGHFQNVKVVDGDDGRAMLEADAIILPDQPFDWARSLMRHAVEFSKLFPDKDFVGLSINASGDAEPKALDDFAKEIQVPESGRLKVQDAIQQGLTEIKVVNTISEAVSCDLVTEAGARGRLLKMLEQEGFMPKKKEESKHEEKHKEEEKKEKAEKPEDEKDVDDAGKKGPADKAPGEDKKADESDDGAKDAGAGDEHKDKDEDVALIKKMLADHLGNDHADNEETMKCAKHYMQAYEGMGYETKDAMKHACQAMKAAKHAKEAMDGDSEKEKKEDDAAAASPAPAASMGGSPAMEDKKEETNGKPDDRSFGAPGLIHITVGNKESNKMSLENENLKLKGEIAGLKEKLEKIELESYIDKKLKETKLPMAITKKFRETEACSKARNQKEVDEKFALFMEGFGISGSKFADTFEDAIAGSEKDYTPAKEGKPGFEDCAE